MKKNQRSYNFASVLRRILFLTVLLASGPNHAQATTPPPYQPPLDYSQESFEKLVEKIDSPITQERESAVYYLGDRLRWKKHQADLRLTYETLRNVFYKEKDISVRNVLLMTLSNIFRGKPDQAPARLFHEEKAFWLSILAESDDVHTVKTTLFLVGYHKAEWADAAVVAALSFPKDSVKIEACKAINNLGLFSAQPVLRSLLREKDESGSLHNACARTLAKVGTKAAISDLTIAMDFEKSKKHSIIEYELAIKAIKGRLKSEGVERNTVR